MTRPDGTLAIVQWTLSRTAGLRGRLLAGTGLQVLSTATQILGILLPVRLLSRAQEPWAFEDSLLLGGAVLTLLISAVSGFAARSLTVDAIVAFEGLQAEAVLQEHIRRARCGSEPDIRTSVALSMTARLVGKLLDAIVRLSIPLGIILTSAVVLALVAPWLLLLGSLVVLVALPLLRGLLTRSKKSGDSLGPLARADAQERRRRLSEHAAGSESEDPSSPESTVPAMRRHMEGYRERLLLAQRSLLTSGFQYAVLIVGGVALLRFSLPEGDPLGGLTSLAVVLILLRYLGNALTRASKEFTVISLYVKPAMRFRAFLEGSDVADDVVAELEDEVEL